jgi:hypothetical protein
MIFPTTLCHTHIQFISVKEYILISSAAGIWEFLASVVGIFFMVHAFTWPLAIFRVFAGANIVVHHKLGKKPTTCNAHPSYPSN